jgi:hypothetical protein
MTGFNLTLQRPKLQSAALKFFIAEEFNFEAETLLGTGVMNSTGQFADVGTVVGKVLGPAVAAAVANTSPAANTGNGTIALGSPAYAAGAQVGSYEMVYISATEFEVYDPSGRMLGVGKNGVAFSDQIVFTATAGGTAFAAGDGFTFAVTQTPNQCTAVNASAVDGSQIAMGVVMHACTANAGADNVGGLVVLERGPAVLLADGLIWPSGSTTPQQTAWLAQLAALGIVVRAS